jgi:excinuclease ABC subunit B
MKRAIDETERRRKIQLQYNKEHNITPTTIKKEIGSIIETLKPLELDDVEKDLSQTDIKALLKEKEMNMKQAAEEMRFEEAAILRDQIVELRKATKFFKKIR